MCGVGYMCGWLHLWLATCVVMISSLQRCMSFMRGYTGDDNGMDGYRYRTSIAIMNQQLDTNWRRSHTGHMMITCLCGPHGNIWECIGVFSGLCISTTSTKCSDLSHVKRCQTHFKTRQTFMSSVVRLGRD